MKIHFLGTAAAEGWPGLFCRCKYCDKARELGGKNIRTRSSVIIDDTLKVDFPPDTYHHILRDNIDLATVKHLLITHSHSDHLQPTDLEKRMPNLAHGIDHPLDIYGHDLAIQNCSKAIDINHERFGVHLVQPFKTFKLSDGTEVTPLLADHDKRETCLLYFIEKNGKSLLYGNDTGWFPDETWDWLEGKSFDVAILDCTKGPIEGYRNHLNIEGVLKKKEIFLSKQMLRENGKIITTHFSHNCGMLHEDLEKTFLPHDVLVAFDGMVYHS